MRKPHMNVGVIGLGASDSMLATASAVARLSSEPGPGVVVLEPNKSMQDSEKQTLIVDDTKPKVELKVLPRRNCPHCYGRGYCGTDVHTKTKIVCRCVKRNYLKANSKARMDDAVQAAKDAEAGKLVPAGINSKSGWDAAPSAEALTPA